MLTWRQIGAELTKALAVLALALCALGVTPALSVAGDPSVTAVGQLAPQLVYCGGGPDHRANNAPCHACRSNSAVLPPPPCEADVAYGAVMRAGFPPLIQVTAAPAPLSPARPRAPPAVGISG